MNCSSCAQPPESCRCLESVPLRLAPVTVVNDTVMADVDRASAIWVREDPRYGPPFLTVFLEPGPKATVDDVRLAVGALVRWKAAVNARAHKPFTEEAALSAVLGLLVQIMGTQARVELRAMRATWAPHGP